MCAASQTHECDMLATLLRHNERGKRLAFAEIWQEKGAPIRTLAGNIRKQRLTGLPAAPLASMVSKPCLGLAAGPNGRVAGRAAAAFPAGAASDCGPEGGCGPRWQEVPPCLRARVKRKGI